MASTALAQLFRGRSCVSKVYPKLHSAQAVVTLPDTALAWDLLRYLGLGLGVLGTLALLRWGLIPVLRVGRSRGAR